MQTCRKLAITTSILIAFSSNSQAMQKNHIGPYIGAAVGYGVTQLARPAGIANFDRNGISWAVLLGYQLNHFIALEAGYNRMNNVEASGVINNISVADTVEPSFTYAAIRAQLNIQKNLYLYGKAGGAYSYGKEKLRVGSTRTVSSTGKIVPYVAAGLAVNLTAQISLFTEWANTFKKGLVPRLSAVSLGVAYNFN